MNFDEIIHREETDCIKYDKMEAFLGKGGIIPMWVADMDFATPSFILDALKKRLEHPILGYSYRSEKTMEAIAGWMWRRHGWKINPNQISFSPGVVPAIFLAIQAFSKPSDAVVVQPPVYFPFFSTVSQTQRQLIHNQLLENNGFYTIDFDDLEEKLAKKPSMLLFSNPHNPVGRAWRKEELEKLVDLCYKSGTIIISDEIHSDLILKGFRHIPTAMSHPKAAEITLTLMAPSKTFNIAGLSTSVVIAENADLLKKYNQALEAAHLAQGNIFGNIALEAAYSQGDSWVDSLVHYLQANLQLLDRLCRKHTDKISFRLPEATYLAWVDCRKMGMSDAKLNQFFLNDVGMGVNIGKLFGAGGEGFVRINLAMPRTRVEEALEGLDKALSASKS
ncbi:MAG: PatB family C-S lyase [Bacteroidales bacterium]|nr:PatB family C-S lyase [Bacteroidales bacterium]